MSGARRLLLVVALVAIAVVPLRAFGGGAAPAGGLSVEASLAGCGISESEIVCEIDVSFGGVAGAEQYTASITRADGSVQDAGTIGTGEGGSASIYVPYVGSGTYTVTVSAWGLDESGDGDSEPELLESENAGAGAADDPDGGEASAKPAEPAKPDAAEAQTAAPQESAGPSPEGGPAPPETQKLPECQPEAEEAAASDPAPESADAEANAAPPEQPPPSPPSECSNPSSDTDGPCCPPAA